uniref:Uncharacterized protein n=1 Tax=Romanomermis culicivorax TaxID=13658 RepID=A0A915K100_ROMCU
MHKKRRRMEKGAEQGDSKKRGGSRRGFQYSNEIVVTEAPPKSSSFHEKSAGRGKFLYRRDAAPPGSNNVRLSDVEYKRGKSDVGNKNVDGKRQECDVRNKNVDVEYKREQSDGIKCYDNLLHRSLRAYNIYLRDFLTDFDDNLRPGTKIQKTVQDLQSAQKYVLYTCHKFKISLGDLERYKQQFKGENFKNAQENCDYSAARKHYLEATQMLPGYGRPYNQLALLAQYTKLYANFSVDQHQKSLKIDDAARKELENRENIMAKSRRNEIWIDPDNCLEKPWPNTKIQNLNDIDLHKQFVIYFLALHGMIFGKIDFV